jgi:L-ascorbate metabolism protein UlaG (beta-lactamase superfamily)
LGRFSVLAKTGHCFFAGDTGYAGHFKQIHARYGAPRVALLPIGAYEPRKLMSYVHMNPQDAVHAHLIYKLIVLLRFTIELFS